MLIGIDGNEANSSRRVGIGYFAYNTLLGLYQYDTQNSYVIYLKNLPLSDLPKATSRWQYKVIGPKKLWTRLALPINLYFGRTKIDIFYSPSHYTPPFCPCPKIATIMDLGYLDSKDQFTSKDIYQLVNWTAESIRSCQHLISISQFTKSEIVKKYHVNPDKITVVYPSVSKPSHLKKTSSLSGFGIKSNSFFLYLGTLKPSKNIPFLIHGFNNYLKNNSPSEDRLVIAGKKGWLYQDIFQVVKSLGLENKVIFTDYLSDSEKLLLLAQAKALVIPSLYEGFGIPALEAMLCQTPVIASNVASLPELVNNRGTLINPTNLAELENSLKSPPPPKANLQKISQEVRQQYNLKTASLNLISVFNKTKLGIITK